MGRKLRLLTSNDDGAGNVLHSCFHPSLLLPAAPFDTSSLYGGREPTASWAMVVDRRMVIACWWWMVDVRGLVETPPVQRRARARTATKPPQQQSSKAAAAASLQHQNQSVLPALLLLFINCHRSSGDIFSQFNLQTISHETNLQICATGSIHPWSLQTYKT